MNPEHTSPGVLASLADKIVDALKRKPGQKGRELASLLGEERKAVNRCLSHNLAGKVVQDSAYRWRLRSSTTPDAKRTVSATPVTELSRLTRYYLECIGQDSDQGVSEFAASKFGEPDYAELPRLPLAGTDWDWWTSPGVERVLAKIKADRSNLIAWLGYPVRLREHRTAKWRGFFVEPVLLWQIALPEHPGDPYRFTDELPIPNFALLRSMAMGDASAVVDEAARLDEELGLNKPLEDLPEADEVIERLVGIRPDWDWQEGIDPEACSPGTPLAQLNQAGIHNRAVIMPGKRSPYTQGLEAELKVIGDAADAQLGGTALGSWLSGKPGVTPVVDNQPLIEVVPMNLEQRAAVLAALSAGHTVVTGPPGTGKSQVVTNLLVNAAWRGMKVLFASKNNKAVDVVEARVNGLGNRPVLLRLGSNEYQTRLADYLTAMLSGSATEDDRVNYQEGVARHQRLAAKMAEFERMRQLTLDARNEVDRLDSDVDPLRASFGDQLFNAIDVRLIDQGEADIAHLDAAIDRLDPARLSLFGKIGLGLGRSGRIAAAKAMAATLRPIAEHLNLAAATVGDVPDLSVVRQWSASVRDGLVSARRVLRYQTALEALRQSPAFEDIARSISDLNAQIADNSGRLWRDWVQLAPSRLTAQQRKDIADYAALLQLLTGKEGETVNSAVKQKARMLQAKVSALFSCWAVTSLSARGKVPLEPASFDLVVIDEASQCDIASALPLLYRAKRSVIIGDPMQLRHISALSRGKDADLQNKYGLIENRAGWMYSISSLYDVAAGVAEPAQIINLRDHHRCHGDIIGFSNKTFYGGKLRVATRYANLKRRSHQDPGVVWQDVRGTTVAPGGSGAQNPTEARAVVDALYDLLITRAYNGTVGVVTPFRAQAQLIQILVAQQPALANLGPRSALLVDTVHRFQGDERDVMLFSPVVSRGVTSGALGFLRSNGNLFNVAITRARGLLQVIGDRAAAASCGVDYLEQFSVYVGTLLTQRPVVEEEHMESMGPMYPSVSRPERVSDWERVLYRALFVAGIRPVPQFSVEQYDLDFAVVVGDRRLNIEVDGERYHRSWTGELCLRDQLRNQRLIELGWEVKRFWVYEIRDRMPDCVQQVKLWMQGAQRGMTRFELTSQQDVRLSPSSHMP